MYKFSQNTFSKGMNKDFDERVIQQDTYRDAVNFLLTNEGEFFSLTKINSSGNTINFELSSSLIGESVEKVELLGSIECNLPNENSAVVLFCRVNDDISLIFTIDLDEGIRYITASGDWLNFNNVEYVDAVVDRDNGVDYVYFVDAVNEPRVISVEEGDGRYGNKYQIANLRVGTLFPLEDLDEEFDAGTLLGGSYQVGYQLVNTSNGLESKPSLFTNPINIVGRNTDNVDDIYGLVPNESSSSALKFKIRLDELFGGQDDIDKLGLFNAVQLLILQHTDGNRVNNDVVYKIAPNKEMYNACTRNEFIYYKGDELFTTVPLSEISTDDLPIKTAKTVTLKEGNLFYGNITYRDLSVKNNEGVPLNSESITKNIGNSSNSIDLKGRYEGLTNGERGYKNSKNTCYYKSERRGEVIRYGIAYTDDWGNWSNPKPCDFSNDSAFQKDPNNSNLNALLVTGHDKNSGRIGIQYTGIENIVSIGNFINLHYEDSSGNTIEVPSLIMEVDTNTVWVDSNIELFDNYQIKTTFDVLGEGKKNNSFSTDWKFPSRKNPKFSLLGGGDTDPYINALGLKIGSISNHPEWAKGYAIVRVARDKNILTQAVSLPTRAVMPSTAADNPDVGENANFDGTFIAKSIIRGGLANIWREVNRLTPHRADESAANGAQLGNSDQRISPMVKLLSPDYMASNVSNSEIYDDTWVNLGKRLDIVDAVSFFSTKPTKFFDGVDVGTNWGDQQGFIFGADAVSNYYYVNGFPSVNINGLRRDVVGENVQIVGDLKIKGTYPMVTAQTPTLLPSSITPDNDYFKIIFKLGDLYGVSQQNGGLLKDIAEKKGVYAELEGGLGDLSYYSCANDPSEISNRFQYWTQYLDFSRRSGNTFYNIPKEVLGLGGNVASDWAGTGWNNLIVRPNTAIGVLSIVNVEKGISDDRYGSLNQEHNYFFTGSYGRIKSATTPINDIEVFGGDTFISKCYFKTKSSEAGIFNPTGNTPTNSDSANRTQAYTDFHEIIGLYMESDVNFDLQADRHAYPITRGLSGIDFKHEYTYPYNFSYSVKNLSKVWRNQSLDIENQTEYGSRIVFTDKHIINSLDNNFKRIRVNSKYDLDGSFGDIEKLIRFSNDVYSLQRNGFSYIPIGKRTIEDGNGGEMVINTSDTITTPNYLLTKNGCQDISSVQVSKESVLWLDRERRDIFIFKGKGSNPMKISSVGMSSAFNFINKDTNVWSSYDFDREEYLLGLDGFNHVFSEKLGVWTSRIWSSEEVRLFGGNDRLYCIGNWDSDCVVEEMYAGNTYLSVLNRVLPCTIELVVNQDVSIPKVFDAVRVDSTYEIPQGRMFVNTDNNSVLDTGIHQFPLRQVRQGGYEIYTIRDQATGQRMRGKAMHLILRDVDSFNHLSVNSVLTKYRESRNPFIKRYGNVQ